MTEPVYHYAVDVSPDRDEPQVVAIEVAHLGETLVKLARYHPATSHRLLITSAEFAATPADAIARFRATWASKRDDAIARLRDAEAMIAWADSHAPSADQDRKNPHDPLMVVTASCRQGQRHEDQTPRPRSLEHVRDAHRRRTAERRRH